jgi:hypothetical protein
MQERSILFGSLLGVDNNLERFVGDLDLLPVRVSVEIGQAERLGASYRLVE